MFSLDPLDPQDPLGGLPSKVVDPRNLSLGLAWDGNGRPILAIIVDHALAIRVPDEALEDLVNGLMEARQELARMAVQASDA